VTKAKKPPTTTLKKDWLSSQEACSYLGISFPTLKKYIADGNLQASQIVERGKIRVSASSIEKLLNR
jgi:excisionase family DNA binding protein